MKTLVMGWFSFELYGATAGDLMACELTCEWARAAGQELDVALAAPFKGGVDWRAVDPGQYSHLVFVCGPFRDSDVTREFLTRFAHCRLIGLNLTMLDPLHLGTPFDFLIERDSSERTNPDITFLSRQPKVPVVGLLLVHPQKEYKDRARHKQANQAIRRLIETREMSVVTIDTRLDENSTGLRTAREVESLIARMDLVLTTRLHGTALAIKNGVPPVVVDPIAGGAKVQSQAEALGWPVHFNVETVTDQALQRAFDYCLTEDARRKARECAERAREKVLRLRDEFVREMSQPAEVAMR